MVGKRSDLRSYARNSLSRHTPQNGLFANKLSLSLKDIKFNKQKFLTCKLVSDIKYHHSGSQNTKLFYPLNYQLNYIIINYFAKFETTKRNISRFLFDPLIFSTTEKLSHQNADK